MLNVFHTVLDEPDLPILPQPTEVIKNGIKTITEYKRNEEDKLVKVIKDGATTVNINHIKSQ